MTVTTQPGRPELRTGMQVRKRNGDDEPVDVNKIVRAIDRCSDDLAEVDPMRVATRTISGLYDGATTAELDKLSIQTAAEMIGEEPQYSQLAARLLSGFIDKEVRNQGVASFSQSVALGHAEGLIGDETAAFVKDNARKLDVAIDRVTPTAASSTSGCAPSTTATCCGTRRRDWSWRPRSTSCCGSPAGWPSRPAEAIEFYRLMSRLAYLPSSPTLFNSGTRHTQMSSCYLVDSPRDDLDSIYSRYAQVAKLSKFAGGIGLSFSRVRSRGALIRGTNGQSNGIVPFLRTLDASVAAVNQGGRRKGAACVYLEPWHPDVEEFLELRDNTGEDARRTHNLNLAHWVPDEFMRRVEADEVWSLIDPDAAPELPDLWGAAFDEAYRRGGGRGPLRAAGEGARPLRADDAHPRPDRQRLDDLQGRRQPHLQPDPGHPGRPGRAPVQPVHRDHRGLLRRRDRRVQPRARSTSPGTSRAPPVDWDALRTRSARRCRCSTGSSTSTTTPAPRRRRPTRAGARWGWG